MTAAVLEQAGEETAARVAAEAERDAAHAKLQEAVRELGRANPRQSATERREWMARLSASVGGHAAILAADARRHHAERASPP